MMKKLILLTAALALSASSNLAGADSTRNQLSQLPSPSPQPYEPSTPALLLIAAGLLILRMRNNNNAPFVGK